MKKLIPLVIVTFMIGLAPAQGQFWKKLKKRAEQAAEETIHRKVEEKTAEETEKAMDSILDAPGKKMRKKKKKGKGNTSDESEDEEYYEEASYEEDENFGEETNDGAVEIYSKFDFVPGDKVIFFDDFANDYVGDFPSKWNTNGSGEIVTVGENSQKWLEIKPGFSVFYMPEMTDLPEEYTIEFDLLATGLDNQTGSTAVLKTILSDEKGFKLGNYAYAQMSFCQYAPVGLWVRNDGQGIMNEISADIREAVRNRPHISIAVNKQRFRLWVNEKKVIDIPKLISKENRPVGLKFELSLFREGKERLFITNLKVAEGGLDLRRKLISEGKVSTNAILFESGSATLQPQSMGVIRQISQVLQQESGMNLNIVGHTDADGDDATNLALSKRRAEAVKNTLVSVYGIDESRLQTEGRGETEPVADNSTTDGKAQNRRVEFIKI